MKHLRMIWIVLIGPVLFSGPVKAAPVTIWTQTQATDASIDTRDNHVAITAADGTIAHAIHPLAATDDNITAAASLTGCASINLVWDAKNFCALGTVSPTPFGRFYTDVVVDGKPDEINHFGVDIGRGQSIRIQLARDGIRFQYKDQNVWRALRTIDRPAGFRGAPKFLAAGRSYEIGANPFGPVAGIHPTGPKFAGQLFDITLSPTPQNQLILTHAEHEAIRQGPVDPVANLLKQSADPTYDAIVKFHPPFRSPREIVGVAAHPLDIGVDWLGRLDVSPWTAPIASFEIDSKPFATESAAITRRLRDGYLPIDNLKTTRDGVDYTLTIFGWSQGFSVDHDLIAYAQLKAHRTSADHALPRTLALVTPKGDRKEFPFTANGDDAVAQIALKFPDPKSAHPVDPSEWNARQDEVAEWWKHHLAAAARWDTPDKRVNEAWHAWLVYSMLNVDTINGYLEPHDGAGFYEEMFGYSVSMHTIALDQLGLHDYAAAILATQIHFQQKDGLYTQACGLTDPGSFLVGLVTHYKMTRDADWLKKVAGNIMRQCDWIIARRGESPQAGMLHGLIKFRPYNDYPDPVYNYLGNAWCCRGLEEAAGALAEIGHADAAQKYAAEAKQYRADILASMSAAAVKVDGITMLPIEPDTHRLLKLTNNLGGDYYGLVASSLLETDFLPTDDPRTQWLVDALGKRGGLIAGLCDFDCGIDHAYTYGYLMNAMRRGEEKKVQLGFWSMLAFGMTRDTYSPVEVTMIETGENQLTLPHLFSCTEQLRLLRNMLLREESDTLVLGQGVPRAWLAPGKHVAVNDAPTFFGPVSYRIESAADGSMSITLAPPTRRPPAKIELHLRHPDRLKIATVQASPSIQLERSDDTITLTNLSAPLHLKVTFGK